MGVAQPLSDAGLSFANRLRNFCSAELDHMTVWIPDFSQMSGVGKNENDLNCPCRPLERAEKQSAQEHGRNLHTLTGIYVEIPAQKMYLFLGDKVLHINRIQPAALPT